MRFDGVDPALQTEVEQAAHLPADGPYRDADVDTARRQIEAVYRKRGYNDAVVTPKVAIDDPASAASVVFAVVPGREQRLADVVVEGTVRSRPEAVVRALGLKPGAPVDFAQWAQARKRIFDTNVFRQVEVTPVEVPGERQRHRAGQRAGHRDRVADVAAPLRSAVQRPRQLRPCGRPRSQDLGVVADIQNRNVLGRAFTFGLYGRVERHLYIEQRLPHVPDVLRPGAADQRVRRRARGRIGSWKALPSRRIRSVREIASIEQRIRRTRSFEIAYGYRLTNEVLDAFDPDDFFLNETLIGRFTAPPSSTAATTRSTRPRAGSGR